MTVARRSSGVLAWAPTIDGKIIPELPFGANPPAVSAYVPLILGTVKNEASPALGNPEMELLTEGELRKRIAAKHGAKTDELIQVFASEFPGSKPVELLSFISDPRKLRTLEIAKSKASQQQAPAYLFWFCWQPKVLDGRLRAFHTIDIPFVFYNTDRSAHMTGGTPEALQLSATMTDAWVQFARTGDPHHSGLAHWPKFEAQRLRTMIFDNHCRAENDPAGKAWRALQSA